VSNVANTIDSLASLMQMLDNDPVENEQIYAYLGAVDEAALATHIANFNAIEAETKPDPLTGKALKSWLSDKNNRKGVAFEQILNSLLMPGGRCFSTWQRLQTDTNELDFLVGLEPLSGLVPTLRAWGPHFICECKSTESFSTTWLQKLYAILNLHNAKVGLVLSKKRPSKLGNGSRAHAAMIKIALLGKTIVTFDLQDVQSCANGTNFLVLLRNRYVEVQTGIAELKMIAGS
jgi:hypothetical protein